jgi:hypothetical protein
MAIARLIRFREAQQTQTERFEVLCFSRLVPFLREYLLACTSNLE